ncbi:FtsX-like permease family protein [Streptomyces sp. NPDC003077]|uniref:ABC transporter permease n=1 Tax=Streptomyces sp. NPDC003077 TaxID=3154443 RepID=UPI0033B1F307
MTTLGLRPATGARPTAAPATGPAAWARDLAMGFRFAVAGGREGWIRTSLTALAVGLGVAVLLLGSSVPTLMNAWHTREKARENLGQAHEPARSDTTLRYERADTTFRDEEVRGRLVRPDGAHPPRPPGVARIPGPGEMVASPALKDLLASPDGALLRERLPYKISGTIGDEGLRGPAELTYLANSPALSPSAGYRIDHFGKEEYPRLPMSTKAVLLVITTCVALLMPVMVFIGTAVRFGGERREQRLAALRLIGADARGTRRVAAGETLFGSLLGLALGAALFLVARQCAGLVTLWDVNVFPADVTPGPALAAAVVVGVPVLSVLTTLFAQRRLIVEPLGVVRDRPPVRRVLWWRLLTPIMGAVLLAPTWPGSPMDTPRLVAGTLLLLLGVTALLPWVVEAVVGRLRGGPVPWELAVRRLQLSSGAATRAVSGITVALTGAIAVHMLFTGFQAGFTYSPDKTNRHPRLEFRAAATSWPDTRRAVADLRDVPGAREAHGVVTAFVSPAGARPVTEESGTGSMEGGYVAVGDCAALRTLADLGSCADGDVFVLDDGVDDNVAYARPGARLDLNPPWPDAPKGPPRPWTVPASARSVNAATTDARSLKHGILATPAALDVSRLQAPEMNLTVGFDPASPDAVERLRNAAARVDPAVFEFPTVRDPYEAQYVGLRTGLLEGSVVTLGLIGAGLIISTVEQLRERRRLLSALAAFGTPRATLGWSILWQTAIPVALGLGLAVVCGLTLGVLLLTRAESPVVVDWPMVAAMTGLGAGVILLVTVLSLPALWRMMRPDGLRTE